MTESSEIRIVGVGSSHGDDAVGWHAINLLRGRRGAETFLVDGGQRLLDVLDGCSALVLIDAVQAGGAPGTVHRFRWPDPRIAALRPGSTHEVSVEEALRLAEALGSAPQTIILYGVEMAQADPPPGLSPPVQAALPVLVSAVLQEVEALQSREAVRR